MRFILDSECSYFDEKGYMSHQALLKNVPFLAQGFIDEGIQSHDVVLIEIESNLEKIQAIFALLYLECILCFLNPKMPNIHKDAVIEDLGEQKLIKHLPKMSSKAYQGKFNLEKPSFLIATSASTSFPKLIALTLEGWYHSAKASCSRFNVKSSDIWVLSLPLFHVSGLSILFRALYSSSIIVFEKPLKVIPSARYSFVPQLLSKLETMPIKAGFLKSSSILIGGAKMSPKLLEKYKDYPIYLTYGMTETYSQISMTEKSPSFVHEGTVMEGKEIRIEDGQVLIKGKACATHRYKQKKLIPLTDEDGYLQTKDAANFETNNLYILGRRDERIEKNGEKIYPCIIEKVLSQILHIDHCIVTSSHGKDRILIGAFVPYIPTDEQKELIKQTLGTLFVPDVYLPFPILTPGIKIPLQDLKNLIDQQN